MPIYLMILLAVVGLFILWLISSYNGLVRLQNTVKEAFATMDVYLQKRFDLIPNLVETVKGYTNHEQETLQQVIAARNAGLGAQSTESKIDADKQLTSAIGRLIALAENYPNLKADGQFQELMKSLNGVEEDIAQYRKYYNATVRQYNTRIQLFPVNLIAGPMGFKPEALFEIADNQARQAVKVQF